LYVVYNVVVVVAGISISYSKMFKKEKKGHRFKIIMD